MVGQLMQGGTIKRRSVSEGRPRWQLDAVLGATIVSPVSLIIHDVRTGVL